MIYVLIMFRSTREARHWKSNYTCAVSDKEEVQSAVVEISPGLRKQGGPSGESSFQDEILYPPFHSLVHSYRGFFFSVCINEYNIENK